MLKSIGAPNQQGADPANHTRVADHELNCLHPTIAGIGTREGYAACLTPLVLFCTVLCTSSKEERDRDRCDKENTMAHTRAQTPRNKVKEN